MMKKGSTCLLGSVFKTGSLKNALKSVSVSLPKTSPFNSSFGSSRSICCAQHMSTIVGSQAVQESTFEISANTFRFGPGLLHEVGADCKSFGMKRVAVITDSGIRKQAFFDTVLSSIRQNGLDVVTYDITSIEPTDKSFLEAGEWLRQSGCDGILSLGGGSVMDTAKAANLFAKYPAPFLRYVNAPVGDGAQVPGPLLPHIACPTTSGTGSECTGLAICDITVMNSKSGIGHKYLKPSLAIVDPTTTYSLPANVVAASGFDVLSHGLESFTAIPYNKKKRAPGAPRPVIQGSTPYSDIGCLEAVRITSKYIVRAVNDATDHEARDAMMFAATLAGTAMGSAGCHLPHAQSYPVSSLIRDFKAEGYPQDEALLPHGMSVIMHAPSVFRLTAKADPEKHMRAAHALGCDCGCATPADSGELIAQKIIQLMKDTHVPSGLLQVGFGKEDIPTLVKGAWPQKRLVDNAPLAVTEEDLASIYEGSLKNWQ